MELTKLVSSLQITIWEEVEEAMETTPSLQPLLLV